MEKFNHINGQPGSSDAKTSREVIDDFFYTYHPAEAEEYLREISAVLRTPGMTITEQEEREYLAFFERMNELIKANYQQRL